MPDKIYLIGKDEDLSPMVEQPYANEDLLQQLLAKYPDLLAGEQMGTETPRRWLLVTREMAVPDSEETRGRWSLDHLFLDQDGIPTLVETKRGTDNRLRREVIGQILDYAANAVTYWPVEDIRNRFERTCEEQGKDPERTLDEFLSAASDQETNRLSQEQFWGLVKTNLEAGKLRMVIVADEIPRETKRIIEFLNEQMDPAEVLGVEIKQFVGEGLRTLVPHVIGQTERATQRKTGARQSRSWDEETFCADLEKRAGADAVRIARDILAWIRPKVSRIKPGSGKEIGSLTPQYNVGSTPVSLFWLLSNGKIGCPFTELAKTEELRDKAVGSGCRDRLNQIPNMAFSDEDISKWPTRPISLLISPDAMKQFKAAYEWVLGELRRED